MNEEEKRGEAPVLTYDVSRAVAVAFHLVVRGEEIVQVGDPRRPRDHATAAVPLVAFRERLTLREVEKAVKDATVEAAVATIERPLPDPEAVFAAQRYRNTQEHPLDPVAGAWLVCLGWLDENQMMQFFHAEVAVRVTP